MIFKYSFYNLNQYNNIKYNKKIMVILLKDVISKDFNLKEFFK